MNARRLAVYAGLVVLLALIGYGLALWGLTACDPPPLPGEDLWTLRRHAGLALAMVLRVGSAACFTNDAAGSLALVIGSKTTGVVLVLLAIIVLWELVGREVRRRWFRMRGGHVVLAGTADDLGELIRGQAHFAGTFFLAPDRATAFDLARRRPFAEILPVDTARLPQQLRRLGAPRARLLAAATPSDLANVAIAEAGLGGAGTGELLVRLEQHAVRNLSSHRLRIRATEQGRRLAVVSLNQLQARRAGAAAMSGRYTIDDGGPGHHPRVHIALCGSGPALQAASYNVARQGFGLEAEKPLLSILRTGSSDFAAGALHRLQVAEIAEVQVADVLSSADGLDRAIGATVLEAPPLLAVHCVGETTGEAEALAQRWEEVLLALHQPVPPIIAYGTNDAALGTTGMVRVATTENLARAREAAQLMDQRARAVHQHFLAAQRAARGDKFGTAPAEVDWGHLPESFQDDNRNVADQMDYKLARVFMLDQAGEGSAPIDGEALETLSGIAHARWWAARALAGWRYGTPRDDRLMLHPSMIPYSALNEAEKQKDRDEVLSLPAMAALAGEALKREYRIGVPRPLEADGLDLFHRALATLPKDQVAVAVIPLDDAAMLPLATALADAGVLIDVMLDRWTDELRRDAEAAPRLASLMRRAWRIHAVLASDARGVLVERVYAMADESGGIDALV